MSEPVPEARCANCLRVVEETDLDPHAWCSDCRKEVVRRSTRLGRGAGAVAALTVAALAFGVFNADPRFLALWLVVIGAVYFVVFTLARRVAFEYVRARGVPAPEE